jgi:hypothetical protein
MRALVFGLILVVGLSPEAWAKSHSSGSSHQSPSSSHYSSATNHHHSSASGHQSAGSRKISNPAPASSAERTKNGKIKRSQTAKKDFEATHTCPSTGKTSGHCPGYVIDHVKPLASGGADAPSNMQWQTVAEGKAKDKWERKGC